MADNSVFITGAAEGAFTEALNGLPPWATENTALSIERYLRKSFDIQTKMLSQLTKSGRSGGLDPKEIEKVNNELDRLAKGIKRQNEEDEKQKKRNKDKENADNERIRGDKGVSLTGRALDKVFSTLTIGGKKVGSVFTEYIAVSNSMFQSGINVLNGNDSTAESMIALQQAVTATGMRLEILKTVSEKYASTINVGSFTKFANAIKVAQPALTNLGYYAKDQAELVGVLMESEIGYRDIRKKSAEQIAADSVRLGTQLTKLSQTVGVNRAELEKNMKQTAKSGDISIVYAKYGEAAAKNMSVATAGMSEQMKSMFTSMGAAANPAQTKEYMDLVKAGMGDLAVRYAQLSKVAMQDPEEFQRQMQYLGKSYEEQAGRMANMSVLYDRGGAEVANLVAGLYQYGRTVSEATSQQQDNAMKSQAAISALNVEIENLLSSAQAAFVPLLSQVDLLTAGLKSLNKGIESIIGTFGVETRSWVGVGLIAFSLGASLAYAAAKAVTFGRSLGGAGSGMPDIDKKGPRGGGGARGGAASRIGSMLKWGVGLGALTYSSGLNTNEDEELKKIWANSKGPYISPTGSTVNNPITEPASSTVKSASSTTTSSAPSVNDKPGSSSDINNLIAYSNSIMAQILDSSNKLVSINSETLRYIKQQ